MQKLSKVNSYHAFNWVPSGRKVQKGVTTSTLRDPFRWSKKSEKIPDILVFITDPIKISAHQHFEPSWEKKTRLIIGAVGWAKSCRTLANRDGGGGGESPLFAAVWTRLPPPLPLDPRGCKTSHMSSMSSMVVKTAYNIFKMVVFSNFFVILRC